MRGHRFRDLTGKTFGSWCVLERAQDCPRPDGKNVYVVWKCRCTCGAIAIKRSGEVRISPRCRQCSGLLRKPKFGPREAVLREFFSNYRSSAKASNREWLLTEIQFRNIVESKCYFCGRPPKLRSNNRHGRCFRSRQEYPANGIDRLNNLFGYTPTNSVPCCEVCNRAKLQMTREEYIEHCRNVVKNVG